MTNNNRTVESPEISERRRINLGLSFLGDSIKSCNASRSMHYIRYVDQFSNTDSLIRYGVDHLKAIDIHKEADKKIREFMDQFFIKCTCLPTKA